MAKPWLDEPVQVTLHGPEPQKSDMPSHADWPLHVTLHGPEPQRMTRSWHVDGSVQLTSHELASVQSMSAGCVPLPSQADVEPQSKRQSPEPHLAVSIWHADSPVQSTLHEVFALQSTDANWHAERPLQSVVHGPPSPQTLAEVWHAEVVEQSRSQPAPPSALHDVDVVSRHVPETHVWLAVHAAPFCHNRFASQLCGRSPRQRLSPLWHWGDPPSPCTETQLPSSLRPVSVHDNLRGSPFTGMQPPQPHARCVVSPLFVTTQSHGPLVPELPPLEPLLPALDPLHDAASRNRAMTKGRMRTRS